MTPECDVSSETGKKNFEHSLIRFPPTVAKSINASQLGDVVVSERDLAEQLRKHPDIVATALNLLLGEQ